MVGNQEQFANSNGAQPKDKKRIEQLMGNLLRAGVILAATIVFLGGMIHLRHGYPVNYQTFQPEPENLRTLTGIFHEAIALHGPGLIQFGLLVLIATPVARVVFSVLAFLYERDWMYVVFTLIVLGLLCYSLFSGQW